MATYAAKQKALSGLTQSDLRSELLYPDLHSALPSAGTDETRSVERKLIGFSLGIGLFLLGLLVLVNHVLPPTS